MENMKHLNKALDLKYLHRSLTTINNKENRKLDSWWLTGLADAESCFRVAIWKDKASKTGWGVRAEFSIELHAKDIAILNKIQYFFGGVGNTYNNKGNGSVIYSVTKLNDLTGVIIPHFNEYWLLTQKRFDFILFKRVVELMQNKEHLSDAGLQKIVSIKSSLNKGLSDELIQSFPNYTQMNRSLVEFTGIPDPNWLAGFVDGEGCFHVQISKDKTYKTGAHVALKFIITQHIRDAELIKSLMNYFGPSVGKVTERKTCVYFIVTKIVDITEKILPFFEKYPLLSTKQKDLSDFCEVASLMKTKVHTTAEGLDQIRLIKSGMNRGRVHNTD